MEALCSFQIYTAHASLPVSDPPVAPGLTASRMRLTEQTGEGAGSSCDELLVVRKVRGVRLVEGGGPLQLCRPAGPIGRLQGPWFGSGRKEAPKQV